VRAPALLYSEAGAILTSARGMRKNTFFCNQSMARTAHGATTTFLPGQPLVHEADWPREIDLGL